MILANALHEIVKTFTDNGLNDGNQIKETDGAATQTWTAATDITIPHNLGYAPNARSVLVARHMEAGSATAAQLVVTTFVIRAIDKTNITIVPTVSVNNTTVAGRNDLTVRIVFLMDREPPKGPYGALS